MFDRSAWTLLEMLAYLPVVECLALLGVGVRSRSWLMALWALGLGAVLCGMQVPDLDSALLPVWAFLMVGTPAVAARNQPFGRAAELWTWSGVRLSCLLMLPLSLLFLWGGTGGADGGTSAFLVVLGSLAPVVLVASSLRTSCLALRGATQSVPLHRRTP